MPLSRLERPPYGPALWFWTVVALRFAGTAAADGPNEERMAACQPRRCGSGPIVRYPFWIEGAHPNYCGMPLFKLTCGGSGNYPILPISGDNYYVHNISYDRGSFELKKLAPKVNSNCTQFPNRNLTLERTPFNVSGTSNATLVFYFRCNRTLLPRPPLAPRPAAGMVRLLPLPCDPLEAGRESFVGYSISPHPPEQPELGGACPPPVALPITPFTPAFPDGYREILDFRISLNWTTTDCTRCQNSGGLCGTNFTDNGFHLICICSDRDHLVSCDGPPKEPQKSTGKLKIIGVAVAGAVLASALMVVFIFFLRRSKARKRSASLSKLIRSTSSERYSMERDAEALGTQTHIFTYRELEEATQGFKESNELGDGGFGTVYKGNLRDGRVVAIKRLYENNFKREDQFRNEVAILNRLRHKNLVSLYGCTSRQSRGLLLVYEYVPNGTVADHLHGPRVEGGALTWPVRMSIAAETAGALAYLHAVEPQIIHRDVKTNNILLDENYHVKVADFGLSRLFPPDATHVSTVPQGTPGYLDPEYHQCYQLTDKSDVYSFGVVLAELISSKPAVDIARKRNEINLANMAVSMIQNCRLQEFVDPALGFDSDPAVRSMIEQVAELAFRCLQAEKEMRPSMEEVVEVLKGITAAGGTGKGHNKGGLVDLDGRKSAEDCASLLNGSVQYSPDTVHADWVSRTTTPNTSGQAST